MRLVFVMPVKAGGGGCHSVIQEAAEMFRMGVDVQVLVTDRVHASFLVFYPPELNVRSFVKSYADVEGLSKALKGADVVVATIFTSIKLIKQAFGFFAKEEPRPEVAYYIQDYEPLFTEHGTAAWQEAMASYTVFPDAICFAKTHWLCDIVAANHGVQVAKVEPSIDHQAYFPQLGRRSEKRSFCAMLRPSTPRRAPHRTARMLNWLAEHYGDRISVRCFGCELEAVAEAGLHLHPAVEVLGHLKREQVAETLRQSDYFLDLSDFQAFGRTGVEAMACGCIPLLPIRGAPPEYVVDGENGLLVDTANDQELIRTLGVMAELSDDDRLAMTGAAIVTASAFSPHQAAISELKVLGVFDRRA